MTDVTERQVWLFTGAAPGRSPSVEDATDEPSHIHIPRPSRFRRADHVVELEEQVEVGLDRSSSLAIQQAA